MTPYELIERYGHLPDCEGFFQTDEAYPHDDREEHRERNPECHARVEGFEEDLPLVLEEFGSCDHE
jgi:hypothetical protein